MNILYTNSSKQIHQLQLDFEKLEQGEDTSSAIQGQISASLGALKKASDDLMQLAKREITEEKREIAYQRAEKIQREYQLLQDSFNRWKQKQLAKKNEEREREMLLRRQDGTMYQQQQNPYLPPMDYFNHESNVLHRTGKQIDDYIAMSKSALQELYDQKNILKRSKTTMLNIANTLGVSQTVIRYIETRTTQDKWILFIGIIVTVFLMWLIVHYLGK
ncbi:hypothetical protein H8356DRAFT_1694577 [Neocallimastix lanati (nom. inval.)]|jgi:Golgi SNAP receptor complex protein 2|uniref:Protein transport protein BOS1 n=1 Tax=Neocallimastix californiae TaxID=1754190 RepID=A0A1Y2D995_9FUNG|nr:hypothetical protein H8356DRAFT_1694577 [Neocallimastix sp. JGI-2020a]ORY55823.1 hypothetical protein LY90DRAFT_669601 [Neocallimastix californiae]|eukprot:ORY55823.1 hypothetical protein LY90DRAFT_669601 [Neocallimastix californiae]